MKIQLNNLIVFLRFKNPNLRTLKNPSKMAILGITQNPNDAQDPEIGEEEEDRIEKSRR